MKESKPQKVVKVIIIDQATKKAKVIEGKRAEQIGTKASIDIGGKKTKGWKPTKAFLKETEINLKTGESTNIYITAKAKEEEEKADIELTEMIGRTWEGLLGEDFFLKVGTYLDAVERKYGKEESDKRFMKLWNKYFLPALEETKNINKKPDKK